MERKGERLGQTEETGQRNKDVPEGFGTRATGAGGDAESAWGFFHLSPPPPHFLSEPRRRGGRGPAIELATHRHKCIQKFGPTLPPRGAQNCVTQKEKNNSEALKGGEGNMEGGEGL